MRELVLIIADLYLPEGESRPPVAGGVELRLAPGVPLATGWRGWLCTRLGRPELAALAPATLAAAALPDGAADGGAAAGRSKPVWLAEPVHLRAGLSHVQLAPDGLLRLEAEECRQLAHDFAATFGADGLALEPLAAGNFLLHGLEAGAPTADPARHLGADVAAALPRGAAAAALRRLGGEIELWLHAHPVNTVRTRRGRAPVSALWIWGGGPRLPLEVHARPPAAGWGRDATAAGLWRLCGGRLAPPPAALGALESDGADSPIVVLEAGARPGGLAALEEQWIAPAAAHLARGRLAMLTLVANDRALSARRTDRLKLWRPRRAWLELLRA